MIELAGLKGVRDSVALGLPNWINMASALWLFVKVFCFEHAFIKK